MKTVLLYRMESINCADLNFNLDPFIYFSGTTDNVKLSGECAETLVGVPVSVFEG